MKKYLVLKLIGLAILTMISLVLISIIEVAIYSYLINPGESQELYEAHAQLSAPFVSGIFGFIVFFLVVRFWKKRGYPNTARLALLFPATYVMLDLIILLIAGVQWSDFILTFLLANGAKFLGSFLGYKLNSAEPDSRQAL